MARSNAIWEWKIVRRAALDALLKLNPRKMMGNPVMFVVEIGSVITTVLSVPGRNGVFVQSSDHAVAVVHRAVRQLRGGDGGRPRQGAGETLRKARSETMANRDHGQRQLRR